MSSLASMSVTDFKLELEVLKQLCVSVNTPRSICIYMLIESEQYADLLSLTVRSEHYNNSVSSIQKFKDDYLVTGFLSKSPNIPLGIDRKAAAVDTFFKGELQCKAATSALRLLDVYSSEYSLILNIKEQLNRILGPMTHKVTRSIERHMRFGPGSTTRVNGSFQAFAKYDGSPHLTSDLYPFYKAILGDRWHENAAEPIIVEGNKFTTVPKNAKTDRGICVEPDLNIYVQLGIGQVLKSRLAATGIDLRDQTNNQKMAAEAQKRNLCTIDLSNASDNISDYLVFLLLDEKWYHTLDLCRSRKTLINGEYHNNYKFSSMGNGYTFELESLIFTSIVRSVVPKKYWKDVSVYGDDIICPQAYSSAVISALELCGFVVNRDKSFLAGSFFESCGTDYFNSVPVRPFYARGRSDSGIPYSVQLANALRLYARTLGYGCDIRFKKLWTYLYKISPEVYRNCHIPSYLGDVGFIDSHDNCEKHASWDGYLTKVISLTSRKFSATSFGYCLWALARIGIEDPISTYNYVPSRGLYGKPIIKSGFIPTIERDLNWLRTN